MKVKEVICCSFSSWYEKFKNITPPSIILPLPLNVLNYLLDDGTLILPDEYGPSYSSYDDDDKEDNDTPRAIAPDLLEFSEKIKAAIDSLHGPVFPKLNWSSPKDASWISFNKSLQCFNSSDVYLLLKSSDFTTHDLIAPFDNCDDGDTHVNNLEYCLVLRKWIEINPSDEFRCFVKNNIFIGISQREISQYYSTIAEDKNNIISDIIDFWKRKISTKFDSISYTFDVHRPTNGIVTLIDFNPFGPPTDALMFSWYELQCDDISKYSIEGIEIADLSLNNKELEVEDRKIDENTINFSKDPEFRFVSYDTGVQPNSYMQYGLPIDLIHFSANQPPGALSKLLQTKIKKETSDSSSDEDSNDPKAFIE